MTYGKNIFEHSYIMDTHQDKQQILETITAVSRLILLSFKPRGTKISIRDHNIVLCEPSCERIYGFRIQQGLGRYLNGDSREDIYVLNHVICHFIEWYIVPNKTNDPDIYHAMIRMAKYLCVSLRELQSTYQTGTVVGMLQYYIIVLTSVITDTYDPRILYQPKRSSSHIAFSTIFDIDKFKSFWSRGELLSISNQFDKCFRMPYDPEIALFRNSTPDILAPSNQAHDALALGNSAPNSGLSDTDASDNEALGNSASDNEALDNEALDNKALDNKALDNKALDNKALDNKALNKGMPEISEPIGARAGKPPDPIKPIVMPVIQSLSNVIVQGNLVGITNILNMMDRRFTTMLSKLVKSI